MVYNLDNEEINNNGETNIKKILNCLIENYPNFLTQREIKELTSVKNNAQVYQKLYDLLTERKVIRFKVNGKFVYGLSPSYAKFKNLEKATDYENKLKEKKLI